MRSLTAILFLIMSVLMSGTAIAAQVPHTNLRTTYYICPQAESAYCLTDNGIGKSWTLATPGSHLTGVCVGGCVVTRTWPTTAKWFVDKYLNDNVIYMENGSHCVFTNGASNATVSASCIPNDRWCVWIVHYQELVAYGMSIRYGTPYVLSTKYDTGNSRVYDNRPGYARYQNWISIQTVPRR